MAEEQVALFGQSINHLGLAIQQFQQVANYLIPSVLVENGLVPALKDFADRLHEMGRLQVYFEHFQIMGRLSREQEIITYRMTQEAVQNALQHANATQIIIQLSRTGNQIVLVVEDNGEGFDLRLSHSKGKNGLQNLRNRAEYLKGTLEVRSELGKGTTIQIEFPQT